MKASQGLALATTVATLVLIAVGAYVRATGSGLGCPDWPTCHGGVVPPGDRQPMIEFSHRFVASLVGLMVIATAAMAWKHYRHAPFTLGAAMLAVPLVVLQGVLGAITVWTELPPEIVATHLLTAMLVLSCQLAVVVSMYAEDPDRRDAFLSLSQARIRPVGTMAVAAIAWMAAVLWMGGYMAESGASTACADWPTCNGLSPLPGADDQEITHMVHRYLAGALVLLVVPFALVAWRRRQELPWVRELAIAVAALYIAQVVVGALNVWWAFPDEMTVAHTAIAAGVWFGLSATAFLALYRPVASRAANSLAAAEVMA